MTSKLIHQDRPGPRAERIDGLVGDRSGHPGPGGRPSRRRFLAAGAMGVAAWASAQRRTVAGGPVDPQFASTVVDEIGGRPVRLALTGTAVRAKLRVRIYAVASYAPEGIVIPGPEALAALDAPKLLHLVFERDVEGATMAKAYRESIGRSFPAPAFAAELAMLERHFTAEPVKRGDHVRLTHVPGVGMGVRVNSQPGLLIANVAFAQAAWGTYLGPNHLGVALKEGLTSRMR